jgi:flagellar biogenesis protein FliO
METVPQVLAVAGVLSLFASMLWWLKRQGFARAKRSARGRQMECLERLPLSPQHTLHLVRLGQTMMVVASSPSGCSLVQNVPGREIGAQ